jgi:uncharacterized protein YfaQ (DUF2300 family)
VRAVYASWREHREVHPTLLIWPGDSLRAVGDPEFTGVVFMALSEDAADRPAQMVAAAAKCKVYALLLTERKGDVIRMLFESEHGTRTWTIPIQTRGDIQLLGRASIKDNAESVGIKWNAN